MKSIPISFAVILLALAVLPVACGSPETPEAAPAPAETDSAAAEIPVETTEEETPPVSDPITELSATMKTNKGDIHLTLFADKTPITVANFVNLVQRGYFDGLTFHRVIPDFMVQGGCPLGTGTGGPGYRFEDEIHPDLKHDRPGILSMANSGPGTNGSQFFITHVPTPWLDGKHSIFGAIVGPEDQDVINAIAGGDTISTITIDGDTGPLLAAQQSHLDEWNAVLDK